MREGSFTLRALIPRSGKEDPIFQGAEYQIRWYSIRRRAKALPIGPPRTKKWAEILSALQRVLGKRCSRTTLLVVEAASGGAGLKSKGDHFRSRVSQSRGSESR